MTSLPLHGLVAATHTPFHSDGSLNLAIVEKQAAHLINNRVLAAFIGGTTGESSSLTLAERQALTVQIDAASLKLYERVHEKYMMDPVIPLKGNTCTGCFMQVGPQVHVTLSKGDALVRCPGCGRIVYLAPGE